MSSLAHVPTDDGRCLWVADSAALADGTEAFPSRDAGTEVCDGTTGAPSERREDYWTRLVWLP